MRKLKKDTWIMLGVMAAVVVATTAVVYMPQTRKLEDMRAQITSQKALLASNAQRAAVLPEVAGRVEQMKILYQELDRRIPGRTELGGFLREISEHVQNSKLTNELIEPGNPSREELFHTLPIIMKLRGPYLALADFLKRIGKMQRLARVQKLNVSSDPKTGELEIELQMNIYFTDTDS